jgi:hypothetical protein
MSNDSACIFARKMVFCAYRSIPIYFSQKETALTKWQGRFFFHIVQMQFYDTPGGGIFLPRQRIDFSQMQLARSFCAARRIR